MYSWVKHFTNVSCCVNILIIVINGVRKYFDRQQSRLTFPSHSVFYTEIWIWRDYRYIHTEKAGGVLASWNDIRKAAVFFFLPCTFAIPVGPQQAKPCLPFPLWLQREARQEAAGMSAVGQPVPGLTGSIPAPAKIRWLVLGCATALPGLLPPAWTLLGCHPCLLPWEREWYFGICQRWYFEESTCFLRRCTIFGQ